VTLPGPGCPRRPASGCRPKSSMTRPVCSARRSTGRLRASAYLDRPGGRGLPDDSGAKPPTCTSKSARTNAERAGDHPPARAACSGYLASHLEREHQQAHAARYANSVIPGSSPYLKSLYEGSTHCVQMSLVTNRGRSSCHECGTTSSPSGPADGDGGGSTPDRIWPRPPPGAGPIWSSTPGRQAPEPTRVLVSAGGRTRRARWAGGR